jgi:hypothetical protein
MATFKIQETGMVEVFNSPFVDGILEDFRLGCEIACEDEGSEGYILCCQEDYNWLVKYDKLDQELEKLKGECLELISERCIISESKDGDMSGDEELALRERMKCKFEYGLGSIVGCYDIDTGIELSIKFCKRFFKLFSNVKTPFICAVDNAACLHTDNFEIRDCDLFNNGHFTDELKPEKFYFQILEKCNFADFCSAVEEGNFMVHFVEEFVEAFGGVIGKERVESVNEAIAKCRENFGLWE